MNRKLQGASKFLVMVGLVLVGNSRAAELPPPTVLVVDKFGVNLINGQVTHKLDTVSIGKDGMGLSHNIAAYTNDFSSDGSHGYQDKFSAVTQYQMFEEDTSGKRDDGISVYDMTDSVRFIVKQNGVRIRADSDITSGYTYESLGDERHKLLINGNYLDWHKPDGTIVKFSRAANARPASGGVMEKVIYPNGFEIETRKPVTTNTGFQLQYIYEPDTRPFDKHAINIIGASIPPINPLGWSNANPKYIRAVNLAEEPCTATGPCSLDWPKATFTWPAGMPRSIYLGNSTFSVQDAEGGLTEFHFKSYDLSVAPWPLISTIPPNKRFNPRLVGIKPAGSDQVTLSYDYKNHFTKGDIVGDSGVDVPLSWAAFDSLASKSGIVISAKNIDVTTGYTIGDSAQGFTENYGSQKGGVISVQTNISPNPGTLISVRTIHGQVLYETGFRNFPMWNSPIDGAFQRFYYTRGNLTKVVSNLGQPDETYIEAEFPASCTTENAKYCNQATWISDAKRNKTFYTYHPLSGQLQTVTSPADKNGLIAETRYSYEQKSARYFRGGVKQLSDKPIWLKTCESTCTESNFNAATRTCGGNDEVVTRYEYEHDNLLMTAMNVYSRRDNKTLRTTYQYDIYGNRIGETKPKAHPLTNTNTTTCVQG